MEEAWVLDAVKKAMFTALMLGGPILLLALLVGLLVSIFQALTQINEATLTFIPKIVAVGAGLLLMGPWLLRVLAFFTTEIYEHLNLHVR